MSWAFVGLEINIETAEAILKESKETSPERATQTGRDRGLWVS